MPLAELKTRLHLLTLAFLYAQVALAQQETALRPLLMASGKTRETKLMSLAGGEGRFADEQGDTTFTPGEWVRWGHPVAPASRTRIECRDGSVFVAKTDWSTKALVTLADGHLRLEHSLFGQIDLPSGEVECWLLGAATEPSRARAIGAEIRAATPRDQDRIWLSSGDSLAGRVVNFDGTLKFEAGGQEIQLAATDVAAIAFADPPETRKASAARYWLGLRDGTLVSATDLEILPAQITASTASGLQLKGNRSNQMVYVQSLEGVRYLSDSAPLEFHHTPYFEGGWDLQTDRNYDEELPRVQQLHYRKCLAMHTAARTVYQVPTGATHFAAEVAIDDSSGQQGSAIFRVYRVTDARPELSYESVVIRGSDSPQPVKVAVEGATVLILVVDFADFGDELDNCLWLDARWVTLKDNT